MSHRTGFSLFARYNKRPRQRFYGIGLRSLEAKEACIALEKSEIAASISYRFTRNTTISLTGGFQSANLCDLRDVSVSLLTLGLKKWAWQDVQPISYPSVGYFDSESFRPGNFDPINPNPAFEQITYQDGYWGAKIVMSFTDDDLAALVESGQLSNPPARDYLLRTLIERRDKIGRYWLSKVNPLDYPRIERSENKALLHFDDLWRIGSLGGGEATYKYEVRSGGEVIVGKVTTGVSVIEISAEHLNIMRARAEDCNGNDECGIFQVRIRTKRGESSWSVPAIFWLRLGGDDGSLTVVGIEHPG